MASTGRKRLNFSESEIEELFEAIVRPLSFSPEVAKWMQEALLASSQDKAKVHESHLSSLQFQYRTLDRKISAIYDDKINGVIDGALWQMTHDRLSAEKRKVEDELRTVGEERGDYLERGVILIELVQSAENAYRKATSEIKRKIIDIVSSNHILEGGSFRFDYRKPFDLLASAPPKDKWWTRRELNPRPKVLHRQLLRVYQVVLIDPGASACKLPKAPADCVFDSDPSARNQRLSQINVISSGILGESRGDVELR